MTEVHNLAKVEVITHTRVKYVGEQEHRPRKGRREDSAFHG